MSTGTNIATKVNRKIQDLQQQQNHPYFGRSSGLLGGLRKARERGREKKLVTPGNNKDATQETFSRQSWLDAVQQTLFEAELPKIVVPI